MRNVLYVVRVRAPGFVRLPDREPFLIDAPGHYAVTRAELVGPFESEAEARRLAFLGTKRRLSPHWWDGRDAPPMKRLLDL